MGSQTLACDNMAEHAGELWVPPSAGDWNGLNGSWRATAPSLFIHSRKEPCSEGGIYLQSRREMDD